MCSIVDALQREWEREKKCNQEKMPKKEYKSDAEKIEKGKFKDGVLIHEQKDIQKWRKKNIMVTKCRTTFNTRHHRSTVPFSCCFLVIINELS